MCYEVKCDRCSKSSWAGCGRHVPSVYQKIPAGQHCNCKDWPGVKLPPASTGPSANDDKATTATVISTGEGKAPAK